jgi:TolB-like protein
MVLPLTRIDPGSFDSPPVAPEDVRWQLGKLLASHWFARSERMCRFLRFAVERALAGTGDEIKEYLVGMEVFDRGADYDPRVDPIVRVEARRLRAKLEAYYESAGKGDAVLIKFPKGAYAVTFLNRTKARHLECTDESVERIAVVPFTNLSPESGDVHFSDGLTEELILLLTHVQGLRVMAWHAGSQFPGLEIDLGSIREELKAGTFLRGSWRRTGVRIRVTAQLVDAKSGTYLWAEAFERNIKDMVAVQEEIARAIVDAVRLKLMLPLAAVPVDRKRTRQSESASALIASRSISARPHSENSQLPAPLPPTTMLDTRRQTLLQLPYGRARLLFRRRLT